MRSKKALALNEIAKIVVGELYRIKITDPWFYEDGGNIEKPSLVNQQHSMMSVLTGIANMKEVNGMRPKLARTILQSRESWIEQGRRTLEFGKGICTDCAAAAAVVFSEKINALNLEANVEIISTGKHAFVVVDRNGDLRAPNQWGDDCFVIDVWYQNQYPKSRELGLFWVSKRSHPMSNTIRQQVNNLRLDAIIIRQELGSLFD